MSESILIFVTTIVIMFPPAQSSERMNIEKQGCSVGREIFS